MKRQRKDGQETRQDLIAAASRIFAENGFRDARNQDISKAAGTNSASINYHFGSKENLYIEAWKYSFALATEKYSFDGGVSTDKPAEERLFGVVLSLLYRMSDPDTYDLDYLHREMANPTGLLEKPFFEALLPFEEYMLNLLAELLGADIGIKELCFCRMMVVGQCFGPILHIRRQRRGQPVPPHVEVMLKEYSVDELARTLTKFTLDGIKGLRTGK